MTSWCSTMVRMRGLQAFVVRSGRSLTFLHSFSLSLIATALLSDTATVPDIFAGLYKWLDAHPTEALFISLKVDIGPTDLELQQTMYDLIATGEGKERWSQLPNSVSTPSSPLRTGSTLLN